MKLMRARSRRAPRPPSRMKRLAASFTARSKSMMPSSGPRSQCGFISKPSAAKSRGVPQRRTSGLSFSSSPTGVESAGMFGVRSSTSRRASSAASRSLPMTASSSLMARTRCLAASASSFWPAAIIWPIDFDVALRSACSASSFAMAARRVSSSSEKRDASHEAWRFFIASATASWLSRTNLMSSIVALLHDGKQ